MNLITVHLMKMWCIKDRWYHGIDIIDHTAEVLGEFNADKAAALEAIGIVAESYAKMKTPVDTGRLRNSISHAVSGDDVYIGTNVLPYAPYVELGTGIYADEGKGRKSPWVWIDKNGKPHKTKGMKPKHFLKKAVQDHQREYKAIIEKNLKNGWINTTEKSVVFFIEKLAARGKIAMLIWY